MKNRKPIPSSRFTPGKRSLPACLVHLCKKSPTLLVALVAVFFTVFFATPAGAQTTIKSFQARIEEPSGFTGTIVLTNNTIRITTNGATIDITGANWVIAPLNLSILGAPSGITAVPTDMSGNPVSVIPVTMTTNNASFSTNVYVSLTFNGATASGVYPLVLNINGGVTNDSSVITVEVGKIWNGPANTPVNGLGNWSSGAEWLGGVPGPNDDVIFTDLGMQTNSLTGFGTPTTNLLVNSLVDQSITIASLRFCATNNVTNFANLYINPGVTLALTGSNGFTMLRDVGYFSSSKINVTIDGTNGTLVVSNNNANFSMLIDGQIASVLDMSGLGNLNLNVNQLPIGDMVAYPNYLSLQTNGYTSGSTLAGSLPQKVLPTWKMPMTNSIRATYVDPFNYTNAASRSYALVLGRNSYSGGSSAADFTMSLGLTNSFFMDGICVAGYASLGSVMNFLNTNSFAVFRNTNGGRMSIFSTADAAGSVYGPSVLGDNTKCASPGVDFTKGTIDMLVDRLYLSMDRANVNASGKGVSQSSFIYARGIIDANNVILGYQSQGNQTNVSNCNATLTVTNTAVLKVNNTLALGYTTASVGSINSPQSGNGKLAIGPGGTVMANNITVGGVTKASTGNTISLTIGASLIVSNSIADATPQGALGTLSFGGSSSLTLFLNGANPPLPIVYVTNLTASGTGNQLIIGGVTNLTFPVTLPLIDGVGTPIVSAAAFDAGVVMPAGSGLHGTLTTSSSNTINISIIARVPNHLVWRGPAGTTGTADWDYTTKNWLDLNTGIMTNYDNPDIIAFDDTPGLATNINLAGSVPFTPTVVNMTNSTAYYTFLNGPNQVLGGPVLNKFGTGGVEVDGNTTFVVALGQGVLNGFAPGSIGGATVSSGAVMSYGGTIGGSVSCAGVGTSSGSIAGTLTVLSGGVMTNSGSLANPFLIQTNAFLFNSPSGVLNNIGAGTTASPQVAAGGTFVNNGTINSPGGSILFVNGTFEDLGGGSDSMTLQSLGLGVGSTFIPGGDGVGTTTIINDGSATFDGAALLVQGSTIVFKVNPGSSPLNTVLNVAHLSFGASASQQTQSGATLQIQNVGGPYAAGQEFTLFNNFEISGTAPFSTGSSTNTFPVISPATPGPGLAWDLTHLWVPQGSIPSGTIGIVSTASAPKLTNSFTGDGTGTNIVAQFSWDQSLLGYRLETLVTPITVGLSATNWSGVSGSWTNTTVTITNAIGTNCVFYRLAFP